MVKSVEVGWMPSLVRLGGDEVVLGGIPCGISVLPPLRNSGGHFGRVVTSLHTWRLFRINIPPIRCWSAWTMPITIRTVLYVCSERVILFGVTSVYFINKSIGR